MQKKKYNLTSALVYLSSEVSSTSDKAQPIAYTQKSYFIKHIYRWWNKS